MRLQHARIQRGPPGPGPGKFPPTDKEMSECRSRIVVKLSPTSDIVPKLTKTRMLAYTEAEVPVRVSFVSFSEL